jgi:undecaprenyl-diphosphatase
MFGGWEGPSTRAASVAMFLAVALPVAWRETPARARMVTVGAFAYAALVAASRVYLGAHFPSDVLAGAVLGAAVGAGVAVVYARRRAA